MWMVYAAGSAVSAALVAIFGKLGLQGVDPTLATIIRSVIMAGVLIMAGFAFGVYDKLALASFGGRAWAFIILSAMAGAASWLFYFIALKAGPASGVSVIDKMSVVLVIIFAALWLGESLTARSALGIVFTVLGTLLILFK